MPENMTTAQIEQYLKTLRMKALAEVIVAVKDGGDSRSEDIDYAAKGALKALLGV